MIRSKKKNYCPDCGERMRVRDTKQRKVKNEIGEEFIFNLRRFRCGECKKIHLEIPDFITPHKQYSKKAIDNIISGKCDYYIVDNSTVYRWKK